jgi:peptidoglycan/LPS O-acetylase OafA/YrhL
VALSIASLTYGALLGAFVLARFSRVRQRDAIAALVGGAAIMIVVVFSRQIGAALGSPALLVALGKLAWPWYVPLGVALTVGIGLISSRTGDRRPETGRPA